MSIVNGKPRENGRGRCRGRRGRGEREARHQKRSSRCFPLLYMYAFPVTTGTAISADTEWLALSTGMNCRHFNTQCRRLNSLNWWGDGNGDGDRGWGGGGARCTVAASYGCSFIHACTLCPIFMSMIISHGVSRKTADTEHFFFRPFFRQFKITYRYCKSTELLQPLPLKKHTHTK